MANLTEIKVGQQRTWASGDYAVVGNPILMTSEQMCETVDVRSGQSVLDVATGTGNAALAAARRGCEVTGIDYVPELLAKAEKRAAAEQLRIRFLHGDAEEIPFSSDSFDVVLSAFGAMFSANQEATAGELVRVCRQGGKIGLVNWTPDGFIGQLFQTVGRHVPPPADLRSPALWGTEARLDELFGNEAAS